MILCTDYVCTLMFFVSTILWHISAWSLRRLSRWISGICSSRNQWCCKMEHFEQFLVLLLALVVGVILIKKITSCLFRLTITLVLLGIIVWFLLNYTSAFHWVYLLRTYKYKAFCIATEAFFYLRRAFPHNKETLFSHQRYAFLKWRSVSPSQLTSFSLVFYSLYSNCSPIGVSSIRKVKYDCWKPFSTILYTSV